MCIVCSERRKLRGKHSCNALIFHFLNFEFAKNRNIYHIITFLLIFMPLECNECELSKFHFVVIVMALSGFESIPKLP